jgi:hypothetical protein
VHEQQQSWIHPKQHSVDLSGFHLPNNYFWIPLT